MATVESPLGKKKVQSPQMKEFDVPDESEFAENSVNPVYNAQRARHSAAMAGYDEKAIKSFQSTLPPENLAATERELE